MRRLRACLAHTSPGRLGSASGPTTWLCLEWLDADRMNAAKAAGSGRESARPVPEERSPRPKSPQWSAARRCASGDSSCRKRCRKRNDTRCASRRSMPLFVQGAKPKAHLARCARTITRVYGRGCLKTESEFEMTRDVATHAMSSRSSPG